MKGKYNFKKEQKIKLYQDDWNCKLCSSNQKLQLHHILHKRNFASSIWNGIWICEDCHKKYGSSSADDTEKHLNITAKHIISRLKLLFKSDIMFNMMDFTSEHDISFILQNWTYYDNSVKVKLYELFGKKLPNRVQK